MSNNDGSGRLEKITLKLGGISHEYRPRTDEERQKCEKLVDRIIQIGENRELKDKDFVYAIQRVGLSEHIIDMVNCKAEQRKLKSILGMAAACVGAYFLNDYVPPELLKPSVFLLGGVGLVNILTRYNADLYQRTMSRLFGN